MSRNRIRLNICGAEFALTSDDSESYIHAIAEEVEAGITEMVEKNPHISITTAGIISALNYCDAQHKAEDAADNLRYAALPGAPLRTDRADGQGNPRAAERPGTGAARPAKARKGSPPAAGLCAPLAGTHPRGTRADRCGRP